jgi:hypothetical protein
MKRRKHRSRSLIGTLFIAGIVCSSAYAFTASISFGGQGNAADGTLTVNDNNVLATYTLVSGDPTKIDKINLTFSGASKPARAATDANSKVQLQTAVAGSYQNCVNTAASDIWVCTYSPTLAVTAVTQLHVVVND